MFPQTQPDPKGTSLEREIQSGERQVVDHHAPPCPRSVSDRPSRYPSRTHSVTRDRNDFPVSSAAAREARLDGSSKKSGRAGNSDTSICACTRPATLRDKTRRATGSASVTPNRSPASSLEISPVFVRRSVAADDNESLLLRMAGLLLGLLGRTPCLEPDNEAGQRSGSRIRDMPIHEFRNPRVANPGRLGHLLPIAASSRQACADTRFDSLCAHFRTIAKLCY